MATFYWAWFLVDGSRSAWKQRVCVECAPDYLRQFSKTVSAARTSTDPFACLSCGASAEHDSDPVYLTLYVPGREPEEHELQLDAACAARLRIPIVSSGERLPDRQQQVRGPSALSSAWGAIGLDTPG